MFSGSCDLFNFGAIVCKAVRPMLSYRCLHCPVRPVCDVGKSWPNGWIDQDITWYGGRPPPRRHYVRWGPISPKKGHSSPNTLFGPCLCGQTVVWIKMLFGTGIDLGPGHIVLDGEPAIDLPKRGHSSQFLAHVCCDQTAGWVKITLGTDVGLGPAHLVSEWGPSSPKRGTAALCLLWPNGHQSQQLLSCCWDIK